MTKKGDFWQVFDSLTPWVRKSFDDLMPSNYVTTGVEHVHVIFGVGSDDLV